MSRAFHFSDWLWLNCDLFLILIMWDWSENDLSIIFYWPIINSSFAISTFLLFVSDLIWSNIIVVERWTSVNVSNSSVKFSQDLIIFATLHNGCFWEFLSKKYLRQISILGTNQKYTYRVLQTIQMKLLLLSVWAELAILGSAKSALKFKYDI